MRALRIPAGLVAVALLGGLAAGANSFKGQEAPEIQVSEWINGDGRTTLADFRGEVVFLEFWQSH